MSLTYRFFIRPEDGPPQGVSRVFRRETEEGNGFAVVFGECDPRVSSHDA